MNVLNDWESTWSKAKAAAAAGKPVEQEELLKRAIWLAKKEFGSSDLRIAMLHLELSDCLEAQAAAKAVEAEVQFIQASAILLKNARRFGLVSDGDSD